MFSLDLEVSPTSYDEYGQPCYPVGQEKGLIEFEENRLTKQALANGYTATVATTLFEIIGRQVALASLRGPVDVMEIGGGTGAWRRYAASLKPTAVAVVFLLK